MEVDYTIFNTPELLQELGDDAQKWAKAFMQIKYTSIKATGIIDNLDEGDMIGWFANAIETACDVRKRAVILQGG